MHHFNVFTIEKIIRELCLISLFGWYSSFYSSANRIGPLLVRSCLWRMGFYFSLVLVRRWWNIRLRATTRVTGQLPSTSFNPSTQKDKIFSPILSTVRQVISWAIVSICYIFIIWGNSWSPSDVRMLGGRYFNSCILSFVLWVLSQW